MMVVAPTIDSSTVDERREYVAHQWRCLHNCEMCGKCAILRGKEAEIIYADYIDGRRSYMDVTLEIRDRNY